MAGDEGDVTEVGGKSTANRYGLNMRGGHKPWDVGSLWMPEKMKKTFFPRATSGNAAQSH